MKTSLMTKQKPTSKQFLGESSTIPDIIMDSLVSKSFPYQGHPHSEQGGFLPQSLSLSVSSTAAKHIILKYAASVTV